MAGSQRILVWDGALRLFHWSLVLLVAAMWWTAENGVMDWHRRMGMILVGPLTFRFVWGLIGSQTARFGSWRIGPSALLGYFKALRSGVHKPSFGHNPAGTLSVIAILVALCVQVGTGRLPFQPLFGLPVLWQLGTIKECIHTRCGVACWAGGGR